MSWVPWLGGYFNMETNAFVSEADMNGRVTLARAGLLQKQASPIQGVSAPPAELANLVLDFKEQYDRSFCSERTQDAAKRMFAAAESALVASRKATNTP